MAKKAACCSGCAHGKPCADAAPAVGEPTRVSPWVATLSSVLAFENGYIAGAGADVPQSVRARAQTAGAMLSDVVGQAIHRPGRRPAKADYPPIQAFRERVNVVTATQIESAVLLDAGTPSLPGRFPTAGWDGEASSASPVADRGGM